MPTGLQTPANHPGLQDGGGVGGVDPDFDTLAELYAFGLTEDPDVDNTLVGSDFDIFFTPEGVLEISETGNADYAAVLRKHTTTTQAINLRQFQLIAKYDFPGGLNTSGGVGIDSTLENELGAQNTFHQWQAQLQLPVLVDWFDPVLVSGAQFSFTRHLLASRSGQPSVWYHNSDGVTFQQTKLPSSGGPYRLGTFVTSMNSADGGFSEPQDGSAIGWRVTGPALDPGIGTSAGIASMWAVLDTKNFGSNQATGHWEIFAAGPTLADGETLALSISANGLVIPGGMAIGDIFCDDITAGDIDCSTLSATVQIDTLDLVVTGDGSISGVLNVLDDLHVTNDATVGGDLTVTGTVTADDFISTSPARFSQGFEAQDDSSVTGDLDVSGLASANAISVGPGVANVASLVATGNVEAATFNGSALPTPGVDVQFFNTPGTTNWTKPTGARVVQVFIIGGGGGGGSGRRGAAGGIRGGGGSGGSASSAFGTFQAPQLGATESLTVGSGGAGGAAIGTDDTNGAVGTTGTSSTFGTVEGVLITAPNGGPGGGGTTSGGTAGAAGSAASGRVGTSSRSIGVIGRVGGNGTGAANTGNPSTASDDWMTCAAGSGGAGGGISAGNANQTGAVGGTAGQAGVTNPNKAVPPAGGAAATAGTSVTGSDAEGGGGGGGGTSGGTVTGGAGGLYGAGGGGGAASLNGSASGAGGAGAKGAVLVISYCG